MFYHNTSNCNWEIVCKHTKNLQHVEENAQHVIRGGRLHTLIKPKRLATARCRWQHWYSSKQQCTRWIAKCAKEKKKGIHSKRKNVQKPSTIIKQIGDVQNPKSRTCFWFPESLPLHSISKSITFKILILNLEGATLWGVDQGGYILTGVEVALHKWSRFLPSLVGGKKPNPA